MKLLDQIIAEHDARSFPAGVDVMAHETELGHADEFQLPEYADYIATSNAIYSVVNYRARQVGTLPLSAFKGRGANKEIRESGPVPDLLRRVNPFWTFSRLMRQTELSMGVWGEGYWAVERDKQGNPAELWWLKSSRVHPVPDANEWLKGFIYESTSGERLPFRTDEIIWFRYPNPLDEYAGLPPIVAARLAADVDSAAMKANRSLFTNGLNLGGMLAPKESVTFSPDQADELERSLERRFKGTDKAHKWAVLRFDAQVHNMGVTPKDAEFVAGLNMTFRHVCRAYGVPSPLLYDMEHATLANLRELQLGYWQDTQVPDCNFYRDDLEEQLLPMFRSDAVDHLAWDFSGVPCLQEAETAIWDRERQAIEVGGLTINEWRKKHGLPPVPWGDVYWAPVNKVPRSDAAAPAVATEGIDTDTEEGRSLLAAAIIADELKGFLANAGHTNGNGAKP